MLCTTSARQINPSDLGMSLAPDDEQANVAVQPVSLLSSTALSFVQHMATRHFQTRSESSENAVIAPGNGGGAGTGNEESYLFSDRVRNPNSITPEQAFVHMIKVLWATLT